MASDRQQFERARLKWRELEKSGAFSMPERIGKTAIIVSTSHVRDISDESRQEIEIFKREARHLADTERARNRRVEVISTMSAMAITEVMQDPEFSTIVTIGHGSLSYLYIDNGKKDDSKRNNRYDWRDVARDSTHLKTGFFVQRHCGNPVRHLSVPLGTFGLAQPNNILAPVNEGFLPDSLPDSIFDRTGLRWLPTSNRPSYEEIKQAYDNRLFTGEGVLDDDEDHSIAAQIQESPTLGPRDITV